MKFHQKSQRCLPSQVVAKQLKTHLYLLLFATTALLLFQILTVCAIVFDEVSSLHIWITISSLANKDPNNARALLFRQVELNWINAPLEDENDYIGLYLDSEADGSSLPVSVHRLNNQMSGQIITDYYLPQLDFFNETHDEAAPPAKLILPLDVEKLRQGVSRMDSDQESITSRIGNAAHKPQLQLNDECIGYCIAYHSRNKILARNCFRTNPNWMRDSFQYIGSRSLPSLMIPGTHNSATYSRQLDKNTLNMINKYQINQDESIFSQLIYGIRHLDLRIGYSKVKQRAERFWIYHDIFRTEVSVDEVLSQVRRFLDLTTHEIVILDFHRFTVGFQNENISTQRERHAKLVNLIYKHLANFIIPSYLGQHAPLNEYIAIGKRVIIGYANRAVIIDSASNQDTKGKLRIRNEDYHTNNNQSTYLGSGQNENNVENNRNNLSGNVGSKLFNKLKTFKLITNSFSRRSASDRKSSNSTALPSDSKMQRLVNPLHEVEDEDVTLSGGQELASNRAALFFAPVRHLWPNKDTLDGLAQYMNETTCRKYFWELRSMMVELTPTVFGAIADKYDGNRKLAQLVNRQVSDWIRDRWLHCINIVASDYFLGNDLIRLSIYANKMRVLHQSRDIELNSYNQCNSFRKVEHLLDKSKIPIQFAYEQQILSPNSSRENELIAHTGADGNQILLRPLVNHSIRQQNHYHHYQQQPNTQQQISGTRELRKESFVDNVSDGFTNLVSSFKRLLNL